MPFGLQWRGCGDFGRILVGSDFESLRRRLEASNAFQDDDSAILRF